MGDGVVVDACGRSRNHPKGKRGRVGNVKITQRQAKLDWTQKVLEIHRPEPLPNGQQHKDPTSIAARRYQKKTRRRRWERFQNGRTYGQPADYARNDNKVLSIRTGLNVAQATVSTLVFTGKIG